MESQELLQPQPRRMVRFMGACGAWAALAVPSALYGFTHDQTESTFAGHEVSISPDFSGYAEADMGAFGPEIRMPIDAPFGIGVHVDVGATESGSYQQLLDRYASIGARPDAEIDRLEHDLLLLAREHALKGATIGLLGPMLWLAIGRARRQELARGAGSFMESTHTRVGGLALAGTILLSASGVTAQDTPGPKTEWYSLKEAFPEAPINPSLVELEIRDSLLASGVRELARGSIAAYNDSKEFYDNLQETLTTNPLAFRELDENEQRFGLVSDRHDNIGMDPILRTMFDQAGVAAVLNAGDDTSTGEPWEAFSIDSFMEAMDGLPVVVALGNHDQGDFIADHYQAAGATVLTGDILTINGVRIIGAPDPRSSAFTSDRINVVSDMATASDLLAEAACQDDIFFEQASTALVHDSDHADAAVAAGCVDLVLAGHTHERIGPERIEVGESTTYSYTTGTAGGASYAIALGKPRRTALVSFVTYKDAEPYSIQWASITTTGAIKLHPERYLSY